MSVDPLAWLVSLEGVPSAFAGARDGIDAVLRDRGLRRTTPEMTAESLLRGAHASAVLEGSASTLAEVRAGEGDEIATDAVRVSTELLALVPVVRRSPLQAFARLHALAGHGSLPVDRLGRPRDAESAGLLRTVADLVTATTEAPALAVAAIVHAELVVNTPFPSHNGIVARAAERLLDRREGCRREVPRRARGRPPGVARRVRVEPPRLLQRLVVRHPLVAALHRRGVRRRCRGQPAGPRCESEHADKLVRRAASGGRTLGQICRWHPSQ